MTFLAGAATRTFREGAAVEVPVAVAAGSEAQRLGCRTVAVASVAADRPVATLERIAGTAVIERGGLNSAPTVRCVATAAIAAEAAGVRVPVAVTALRVGNRPVLTRCTVAFAHAGLCGAMTLGAVHRLMPAG